MCHAIAGSRNLLKRFGSNNSSRLIKAYYIKSIDELFRLKDEMIHFAEYFNARVGINLNKRSFEKTAFNTLKKIAEQMHNKNFKDVRRAWNISCGIHNGIDDKLWIIDIDHKDYKKIKILKNFINNADGRELYKCKALIPSKSGFHLITSGFNTQDFIKVGEKYEIHKNNPTNLYIP